ncbi:hypothetical protein [Erwinia piriflorinigrans]|nr:hypothetical protein [Erwinia piriflorinigrans]
MQVLLALSFAKAQPADGNALPAGSGGYILDFRYHLYDVLPALISGI